MKTVGRWHQAIIEEGLLREALIDFEGSLGLQFNGLFYELFHKFLALGVREIIFYCQADLPAGRGREKHLAQAITGVHKFFGVVIKFLAGSNARDQLDKS